MALLISGKKAFVTAMVPNRLTSQVFLKMLIEVHSTAPYGLIPALFTKPQRTSASETAIVWVGNINHYISQKTRFTSRPKKILHAAESAVDLLLLGHVHLQDVQAAGSLAPQPLGALAAAVRQEAAGEHAETLEHRQDTFKTCLK